MVPVKLEHMIQTPQPLRIPVPVPKERAEQSTLPFTDIIESYKSIENLGGLDTV